MTQLEDIKTTISKLSDDEIVRLREWLAELEAQRFDERIERDAASGKLDVLMERAKANFAAGRMQEL